MTIYAASSWENRRYDDVIQTLRRHGHEVFDFRNPPGGLARRVERRLGTAKEYRSFLSSPNAASAFKCDYRAMRLSDACVLILPSGRSSHIEAGWFCGHGKPCFVLAEDSEIDHPELMYALSTLVATDLDELVTVLELYDSFAVAS